MGLPNPLDWFRRDTPPALQRRSFDAATGGRRAPSTFSRINPEVSAAAETVASRARYLAYNNQWIANATANLVTSLIGSGIRPNPSEDDRKTVSAAFDRWAAHADAAGVMDFWGVQALMAQHLVIDGEALALLHRDPDGLRIQVLDPSQLDWSKSLDFPDGRQIVQGVELDPRGRRLAYWIVPEKPSGEWIGRYASQRIDAVDVIHVFKPTAAGQVRGISWLAPAVLPASGLDQLFDSALVQAKTQALLSAWLVNQNDMTGAAPFDGDMSDISLEPGTVRVLPGGWDIRFLEPEGTKDFPATARLHLQGLAAALGLPEHLLSGDLSQANYSSLRAGLLPFRQRIEAVQYGILVPQLLLPVWRAWLLGEVLSGRLDVSPDMPVEWIPPKQPWVDPAKDLQATETALRLGLMSRSQAVAELGWSVTDLDSEIAADREREKALGLDFSTQKDSSQ